MEVVSEIGTADRLVQLQLAESDRLRSVGLDERKGKIVEFNKKAVAKDATGASNLDISASSGGRPSALAEPELRVVITQIVQYGTIWQTRHAGRDRDYRNVSDDDIQAMLLGDWGLERTPEWNEEHRNWKYRLLGKDIEGDELTVDCDRKYGRRDARGDYEVLGATGGTDGNRDGAEG